MTESGSLSRLGSTIRYWITGPETGPLVAFSHGATLDHRTFDPQIPQLVAAGYRVLTWDLRGHGISKPIGPEITVGIVADDLLAIVDRLGVDKVALVGHSFGGYVVQEFTRRYPQRVNAMTVIGCTDMAKRPSPIYRLLYPLMPKMLRRMSLAAFRRRTLAELSLSDSVKAYAAQAMGGISKEDFVAIIMVGVACLWLDGGFGPGYVIPAPFLLTHGASDRANGGVFPRLARSWAAQQKTCRYEIIPDAGHTAHMDNPAAFNRVLLDFLRKHVPTVSGIQGA
jgi:3-oxoadipate enol-lactonase